MLTENITAQYQIYCDMDGVLVNFPKGIFEELERWRKRFIEDRAYFETLEPNNKNKEYRIYKHLKKISKEHDLSVPFKLEHALTDYPQAIKSITNLTYECLKDSVEFWAELEWAPGGQELWSFISKYDPSILTTGTDHKSEIGKKIWCKKHLGLNANRVIVTPNKGIDTGNKIGILIDDRENPLNQFHGMKIKYETGTPLEAIKKLKALGFV